MSTPSTLAVVESVLDEGRLSALVGQRFARRGCASNRTSR